MTDYIKRELPDVFYVDPTQLTGSDPSYPLNFAANSYLPGPLPTTYGAADFVLPLGTGTRRCRPRPPC